MTGWFIGMQDTRTPMVVSITQNIFNIVASLVLVFGFKMQIEGVALGTLIAQWSGAVMAWNNLPRLLRRKWGSGSPLWGRSHIGGCSKDPSRLRRRGGPSGLQSFSKQAGNREAPPSFGGVGGGFSSSFFHANFDLFLRTICLVAVNLFFTSAGARQGDMLLSVNTLLMTFFTLFSYVMDGFANAGEALCGKYDGSTSPQSLQAVIRHLFRWGWLMVVLFTAVYALGGRGFLGLLTDEASVVDAAMEYLPWALLIPVAGMSAFVYDGIFIGLLKTRGMLVASAVATIVFFGLYFALFPVWGNHALWFALIVYLALRGLVQHVYLVESL